MVNKQLEDIISKIDAQRVQIRKLGQTLRAYDALLKRESNYHPARDNCSYSMYNSRRKK